MKVATTLVCVVLALLNTTASDSIRQREWMLQALRVDDAQMISTGAGVIVGVIDTGIDARHVDLAGRIESQADVTDTGLNDTSGHGTLMAGLVAGAGHGPRHSEGLLGIAPSARIVSIKTAVTAGSGNEALGRALQLATAEHARVICLALGGPGDDASLRGAILVAERADIVVVAAAGNRPEAQAVGFPAAYPGVIAAAGTDENGNHADISVTGPAVVLSAPATNIVSTLNDGGYGIGTGTSNSTAIIAGAAALVRSKFPHLSAAEVVHRLTATAIDRGPPGRDDEYGYGIVNLVGALTADVPPLAPSADLTPSPIPVASGAHHDTKLQPLVFALIGVLAVGALWLTLKRRLS